MSTTAVYGYKMSGWTGTDTSRDAEPLRRHRQEDVLLLAAAGTSAGVTVREVRERLGMHHGTASSALTNLHAQGRLVRLSEKRGRCKVYVLPQYVNGRAVEAVAHNKPRVVDDANAVRLVLAAQALRKAGKSGAYSAEQLEQGWKRWEKSVQEFKASR